VNPQVAVAEYSWFEYYTAPRPGERLVEVERLRALEEDCVPLLCEHLRDTRLRVRTIAAWTLAEVGDDRAVSPLCDALEAARCGPSLGARCLSKLIGIWAAVLATLLAFGTSTAPSRFWYDRGEIFAALWRENVTGLRGHEAFLSAVITALDRIIERHPLPAARRALTPLNRLSEDTLRHQPETRDQAKRTAHRIQLATHNRRRLPVPCEAAPPVSNNLPLPADLMNARSS
jgi:hypothetical protein